jgi:ribosomal protein S18 acetylase RimI-like enzyme
MNVEVVDPSATSELRRSVLRPGWPVGATMHGDDEPAAVHLAARAPDGSVIGACVLLPRACPAFPDASGTWQLRGMATAADVRGRGIGTALTDAAVAAVRQRGGRLIWCDARKSAVEFYRGRGFTATGESYAHHETGAPHLLMYRELSRGPTSSTD